MVNAKVCHSWSRSQTPQDQGYLTQWLPGQLNEVKQIPSKQEGKLSYQEHMTKMNLLFHTFEPAVCVCGGGDSQYLRCLGYLFFCCNAKYLAFFYLPTVHASYRILRLLLNSQQKEAERSGRVFPEHHCTLGKYCSAVLPVMFPLLQRSLQIFCWLLC